MIFDIPDYGRGQPHGRSATSDADAMSGVPSPGLIATALIAVGHVYRVSW